MPVYDRPIIEHVAQEAIWSVEAKGLVEKPSPSNAPSDFAILNRYELFSRVPEPFEHTVACEGSEVQLAGARGEGLQRPGVNAVETDAQVVDCVNKLRLWSADSAVGFRDVETERAGKTFFLEEVA